MVRERRTRAVSLVVALLGIVSVGVVACSGGSDTSAGGGDAPVGGSNADVNSGGTGAKLAEGSQCTTSADCQTGACKGGVCAAPAPDDGIKNGTETDTDCGGANAPKCDVGKTCATDADCTSDACSYEKKCIEAKSCTAHFGGDTCGAGETGTADAKHESCCTTVNITDRPAAQGGAFKIDKYQVTAGRMRAFIEKVNGNVQQWVSTAKPTGWDDAWTAKLPSSMDEALNQLGTSGMRACSVEGDGGRTYWQDIQGGERSDFSQDVLDEKALNCVTWQLAQALCAYDGKRLIKNSEVWWVYENRGRTEGPTAYPWQWTDPAGFTAKQQNDHLVHAYSYATPNPPATMRISPLGDWPLDHAFYMAPPGRRPTGVDMYGVEDMAGDMLPWVGDGPNMFAWTASWENHPKDKSASPEAWSGPKHVDGPDGYYAIGARCASN